MSTQTPPDNILRVAIYIRVSSDEQAKFGDSVRDQKESNLEYINRHENMILEEIYIDDGISGQKLDRDDFSRLIDHVKTGKVDLIIFTKLDRWFRSLRHYLNTQVILDEHGVSWIATDQPYFDTSTPHGRAFVNQSMMWAELEAQNDGVRIRDVFKNKVSHGEVITGKVPRGFRIENKHLVPDEYAPIVLDIFTYFQRTQSLSGTITYMREEYNLTMTLTNLKNSILRNTKYTGRYRDNEQYCPRIVDDHLFHDVQRILDQNMNIKSNQRYPYLFSGLLVCDECGYKMGGCHINVLSKRKSGKVYRYKYPAYECKQRRAYHSCDNGGEIRELHIENYLLENIREEISGYLVTYLATSGDMIDNRSKKKALRKKLERLKDLYLNEIISLDEYKVDHARLTEQLEAMPDIIESAHDFTYLHQLLNSDFEVIYLSFSNEEKRGFWRSVIKEIRVTRSTNRRREFKVIFL